MAGKRAYRGTRIRRVAPTWVTPRFTEGDVLMLMDPDTWRNCGVQRPYSASLYAALAALAACARVRPTTALRMRIEDYRNDTLVTGSSGGSVSYPVVLLPVVKAAIDAYLGDRDRFGIGGDNLFVCGQGRPLAGSNIYSRLDAGIRRYGHYGGEAVKRLLEFFDDQFLTEGRDVPAVLALRGGRKWDPNRPATLEAAADRGRLRKVLERNHVFAGNPGRWLGGHGKAKAAKSARLFHYACRSIPNLPFLRSDPVCARLLACDWLGRGGRARRARIVREDLPYLVDLLDAGKIGRPAIAYLLCVRVQAATNLVRDHRAARETSQEKLQRETRTAEWRERAIASYCARPQGETVRAFYERLTAEHGYPFSWGVLVQSIARADLLPGQIRRRQKKGMSAFSKKSEIPMLRSRENDRIGRHRGASEGLKEPQNGLRVPKTP